MKGTQVIIVPRTSFTWIEMVKTWLGGHEILDLEGLSKKVED